jgi:Fe-S-cluster-containing hydrogenase component 2
LFLILVVCEMLYCGGCDLCMHVCSLCAIAFPTIESTDGVPRKGRCTSTKKRRTRDKLLKESHLLVAYLNPNNTHCITSTLVYQYALFSYC